MEEASVKTLKGMNLELVILDYLDGRNTGFLTSLGYSAVAVGDTFSAWSIQLNHTNSYTVNRAEGLGG